MVLIFLPTHDSQLYSRGRTKTIHVFVALCDNKSQGIVPVPSHLGNGDDPRRNLYWGARYGVKTVFKRNRNWLLIHREKNKKGIILERLVFKHRYRQTLLIADAYRGSQIKKAVTDFLMALAGRNELKLKYENKIFRGGGSSDLVVYIGHNGLMDFRIKSIRSNVKKRTTKAIILACYSKQYFKWHLKRTKAYPLLWSTHRMAPEAYILEAALRGWLRGESNSRVRNRSALAYHRYQRCGIRGAKRLLVTGW